VLAGNKAQNPGE